MMEGGGGFQSSSLGSGHHRGRNSPASTQSGPGGRFHHSLSRGSYKQMHESREDWLVEGSRAAVADVESPGAHQSWFSTSQPSETSLSTSSPAHGGGGFMLASNVSSNQHPYLPHSLSSSLLAPSPLPTSASLSASPAESSSADPPPPPPALWGEVRGRGEEGEEGGGGGGGGKEGLKWPSRPLWQDGWRAQGLVCSVPQLLQHPSPSPSPLELSKYECSKSCNPVPSMCLL